MAEKTLYEQWKERVDELVQGVEYDEENAKKEFERGMPPTIFAARKVNRTRKK